MKSVRLFILILILTSITLACSPIESRSPGASGSGSESQGASGSILFSDAFSTTDNKWDQFSGEQSSTDYYNDAYRIQVTDTNSDAWANPGNRSFTDVRIEVDATKNSGPDDNDFGIICRYVDENQFYYALISSDGYYGILKMSADGGMPIGNDTLMETGTVRQGEATNHLRFDCIGPTLTLYVNGDLVDQQTDSDFTAGNVGLIAGTFDTAGTDILFDNFVVSQP